MSQNAQASWLVSYDICCPRRLARVFRLLKGEGISVQFSLFSVRASLVEMQVLIARLGPLIEPQDDLRAYHLPARHWQASLGEPRLAADIWLT